MSMVLLRVLEDRFQADVWRQALDAEEVPYLFKSNEDTAYAGIFVNQKGFAAIFVEEEDLVRAREIDAGLRDQLPVGKEAPGDISSRMDHTLLKSEAGSADLDRLLEEALEMSCAAVCVSPWMVETAARRLRNSGIAVCTVVDFPLGLGSATDKLMAAKNAVLAGAEELDVVLNRGLAMNGEMARALEEVVAVAEAVDPVIVKVILETGALGPDLSRKAARELADGPVAFLKTGTGFFNSATRQDVEILAEAEGPDMGIKAAGGIRTLDDALGMIAAGADRLGSSNGYAIWQEARKRWPSDA